MIIVHTLLKSHLQGLCNRLHVLSRGSNTRGKYYGNQNRDGGGDGWNRDSGGNGLRNCGIRNNGGGESGWSNRNRIGNDIANWNGGGNGFNRDGGGNSSGNCGNWSNGGGESGWNN